MGETKNRYQCRWKQADPELGEAGPQMHYWVDTCPQEAHWPDSGVMRWDLRPDDWHEVWPELIDHPCAILFAPIHPHRDGPPRFKDWVSSWPEGYNWQANVHEHLHARVLAILEGGNVDMAEESKQVEPVAAQVDRECAAPPGSIASPATTDICRAKLSTLQIAAIDAFETALRKKLISNTECLKLLTDWQTRINDN
ncbi:hypothetical protein [Paraburkholderia fungorum]